jgi:hypothetical protein
MESLQTMCSGISLDEKIESEECSIKLLTEGEPSRDSLIQITGKFMPCYLMNKMKLLTCGNINHQGY